MTLMRPIDVNRFVNLKQKKVLSRLQPFRKRPTKCCGCWTFIDLTNTELYSLKYINKTLPHFLRSHGLDGKAPA